MGLAASGQLLAAWTGPLGGGEGRDWGRVQVTEAPTDPSQGPEKWGLRLA